MTPIYLFKVKEPRSFSLDGSVAPERIELDIDLCAFPDAAYRCRTGKRKINNRDFDAETH
jgi:hypothetical protein